VSAHAVLDGPPNSTLSPIVAVLERDGDRRNNLCGLLEADGYVAWPTHDRAQLVAALQSPRPPILVVTDVAPQDGGLEVLDEVRRVSPAPVIVVTSAASDHTTVRALRRGADDCIASPFSGAELLARVDAVLRRAGLTRPEPDLVIGDLRVDTSAREVWVRGELVELTRREFDLLAFLAARPGRVFTRRQLLRQVWNSSSDYQSESTITEHIRRIRRAIEARPRDRYLDTVRGVGYRFRRLAV
jgi:two-component system phosphate regulon response regulator PhoB